MFSSQNEVVMNQIEVYTIWCNAPNTATWVLSLEDEKQTIGEIVCRKESECDEDWQADIAYFNLKLISVENLRWHPDSPVQEFPEKYKSGSIAFLKKTPKQPHN